MDGNVSGCLKEHPVVSTRSPVGHFAALFAFNIVTIIPLHLLMWKVAIKYTTWTWCATLVQMSTLDVIANILSWWLIESIRVFNFSVWFGHFGARRSSSNRNHEMILTAQLNTEKLRQSLKPETDPESELLPSGWQRLLENWEIFVLFIRFSWMWPKTIFPPQLDTKLVFFCFLFSIWGGMVKVRVGLDTYNYLVKFKERLQFGLERLCTGHGYGHQLFLSIESWVG